MAPDHEQTVPATPARMFALLAGGLLCALGMAGLLVAGDFRTGDGLAEGRDELIGLDVNGWTAAAWFVTGIAGLLLARSAATAFALAAGLLLAVAGLLALGAGDEGVRFDRFAVDDSGGYLCLTLGALGVLAWVATMRPPLEVLRRSPDSP